MDHSAGLCGHCWHFFPALPLKNTQGKISLLHYRANKQNYLLLYPRAQAAYDVNEFLLLTSHEIAFCKRDCSSRKAGRTFTALPQAGQDLCCPVLLLRRQLKSPGPEQQKPPAWPHQHLLPALLVLPLHLLHAQHGELVSCCPIPGSPPLLLSGKPQEPASWSLCLI